MEGGQGDKCGDKVSPAALVWGLYLRSDPTFFHSTGGALSVPYVDSEGHSHEKRPAG